MNKGTPKTLEEAVCNGTGVANNMNKVIALHVKDFLAQKFMIAMLKADHKTSKKLEELWNKITENL